MNNLYLRFLSYLVIVYMLLAFGWWSVLLFKKNEDAFLAKAEYMKLVMMSEGDTTPSEFANSAAYQALSEKYKRQEWMIFGEAAVFILSLVIGIYLINRAYYREVQSAASHRNFLLSITHELKSPLASIQLALETFLKRELPPNQVQKLSRGALQETNRLHGLVENLLLAARLETNYQPEKERIDLRKMIEEWVSYIENKWPEVVISIEAPEPLYMIFADRQGINSIGLNLLENAVKYSPSPARIQIRLSRQKDQILLEVADKGYGISEKDKKKVFNRFFRAGNEDTRTTKGTGLGLYIVEQIARAHGGKVSVKDNPGDGSVFSLMMEAAENNKTNTS